MWYVIIGAILLLPIAYVVSLDIEPEDGSDYFICALAGLIGAGVWPVALTLAAVIYGIKGLEKLRRGSRLRITWRNK